MSVSKPLAMFFHFHLHSGGAGSQLIGCIWLAVQLSTLQDGIMSLDTPLAMFDTVTCNQGMQHNSRSYVFGSAAQHAAGRRHVPRQPTGYVFHSHLQLSTP